VSDIHIIGKEGKRTEFMFRIDGNLKMFHVQENTMPEAIAAVVKDRSKNVDRFEREMSQDGFIQRMVDGHNIRYRVSIMPIVGTEFKHKFESIVIRVLDDRKVITDLSKLGLQGPAKDFFYKAISKPQGIVILTGPTGSGKSTTLIAALHQVIDPTVNVLTVEEPVEYIIKGARQLKIGHKMDFDQAIRGILRHDPDIVLVGEMRDKMTAEIAIKLANTGHLTFSTLHTNDAPSAVARLYKMGVEPFLIAYAINIIVAQRLIRTLCKLCKKAVKLSDKERLIYLKFGFTEEMLNNSTFYEPVGCDRCNQGWKGRAAIHEALYFTREIKQIIVSSGSDVDENAIREQAVKDGMWTLRRSGMERMMEGITTLEEIIATTAEDD
jgi:type IV pilus assembly protein PilB